MSETDAEIVSNLIELIDDVKTYDPDLGNVLTSFLDDLETLNNKVEGRRNCMKRYFQSEKGKKALAKANKKYYQKTYKPTGRPRGRPRKATNQEEKPEGEKE